MRNLVLDGLEYNDSSLPLVIAELGHNHQGNLETCLQMIRAAAFSGASAVKLQKRSNRNLFTKEAFDAPYNSENAYGPTYGLHREALEFDEEEYKECILEAKRNHVTFFSTAFDFQSVDFLMNLGVPAIKIASGDLKFTPLLKYVSTLGVPLVVSTGGADISDVDRAVELLSNAGAQFSVLQCTAGYPPKYEELNLRVIETYRERYPNTVIGYSGHDSGIAMSLVAYVLGARVIEKHFTLNRTMKGTDHAFSLEPGGMRKLVRDLERAQISLGDGVKRTYESEMIPIRKMGKMIVAAKDVAPGTIADITMFEFRSPAEGLPPYRIDDLMGMKFTKQVSAGDTIKEEDFEKQ